MDLIIIVVFLVLILVTVLLCMPKKKTLRKEIEFGKKNAQSKKGSKGSDWKGKIFIKLHPPDHNNLFHESTEETVLNIWKYKCKLSDWQLTQIFLYHAFFVLKTNNWWWAIEKDGEGINIQRSRNLADVKEKRPDGTERPSPIVEIESTESTSWGLTMESLIDFIADHELDEDHKYHFTNANCQHFAEGLYDAILRTKK